ncbi:MAG: site-2 protease family protein [Candidatus Nealsonbacteria bacterium]|nr:site-2 protease family protein [Candidatus Nealsonbacteria bacterium]
MDIIISLFFLIVLFFSVVIHEIAHGSMALYLGDTTAKDAGRLTLNPIPHLDPVGSVLLPLLMFVATAGNGPIIGWAKPVPVNPYNFRDKKYGELKVSFAGPATNLLIGAVFALMIRFLPLPGVMRMFFGIISIYNFALALFNLTPIPPLDGYHILFTFLSPGSAIREFLSKYSLFILLTFILVNGFGLIFLGAEWLFGLLSGLSGLAV